MSVLNQMLNDLSTRGALMPAGGATVAPGVVAPASAAVTRNTVRRVVWPTLALGCVAFVGALHWMQEHARNPQLSGRPRSVVAVPAELPAETVAATIPAAEPAAEPASAPSNDVPPDAAPAPAAWQGSAPASAPRAATLPSRTLSPVTRLRPVSPKTIGPRDVADATPAPSTTALVAEAPTIQRRLPAAQELAADMARASELIARGRNTEAIELLRSVLARDASQASARAALAALLGEAGRRDDALAVLLEGTKVDPLRFAMPAARLQHDLGDTAGALATLAAVPASQRSGAHHALAGGLAYQAGRHREAVDAYRSALSTPDALPVWWLGLGLAHEAAGQGAEAHAAFSRLADARALPAEMQRFVAQRMAATASAAARGTAVAPASSGAVEGFAVGALR